MLRRTSFRKAVSGRRSSARIKKAVETALRGQSMVAELLEPRRLLSWTPGDGAGWVIGGTGDFNGDGHADIVWRNQPVAGTALPGEVRIQYMQGNSVLSVADVTVNGEAFHTFQPNPSIPTTASNPNFIVPAVGEFNLPNSNGPEIVALNGSTKWVYLWGMDGSARTVSKEVGQLNNSQWYIVGSGDFNGDGMGDILWWNSGFLTDGTPVPGGGNLGIWQLNNNHVPSWQSLTTPGGTAYTMSPSTWRVAGVADFNNDGTPDVAWQKKAQPAELRVWSTSGSNVTASTTISGTPGTSGITYQMQGIADMDGNGTLDFLLRQMSGPNNYVWHTNTSNPMQWSSTGALGQSPSLAPPALQAPTGVGSSEVTLQWNDVNYETGYEIWSRAGSGSWELAATVGQNVSNKTVSGLLSGTQYAFQVRAKTAAAGDQVSNIKSATTAAGATTWIGAGGDGLWSNPSNWHTNQVPGSTTDVIIPATAAEYIVVDGVQEVNSLVTSETLRVSGSLKVLTAAEVTASAVVDLHGGTLAGGVWLGDGTISAAGGGTLDAITLGMSAQAPAAQELRIVNGLTVMGTSASLGGVGVVRFENTQSITGASATLSIVDANIDVDDGTLTLSSGTTIAGTGILASQTGTGVLINGGTIATGASGTLLIDVPQFENAGLINAQQGSLKITSASWTNTGTGTIDGEGGDIELAGGFVNTGYLVLAGKSVQLDGTIYNEDGVIHLVGESVESTATIYGGSFSVNSLIIAVSGAWHGVELRSDVYIADYGVLEIYDGLHLYLGSHILTKDQSTLRFSGSQTVTGYGGFYLRENFANSKIEVDGVVNITETVFILGAGTIQGVDSDAALTIDFALLAMGDLTATLPIRTHIAMSHGHLSFDGEVTGRIVVFDTSTASFNGDLIAGSSVYSDHNVFELHWTAPSDPTDYVWVGATRNGLLYELDLSIREMEVEGDYTPPNRFARFTVDPNSPPLHAAAFIEKEGYTIIYSAFLHYSYPF